MLYAISCYIGRRHIGTGLYVSKATWCYTEGMGAWNIDRWYQYAVHPCSFLSVHRQRNVSELSWIRMVTAGKLQRWLLQWDKIELRCSPAFLFYYTFRCHESFKMLTLVTWVYIHRCVIFTVIDSAKWYQRNYTAFVEPFVNTLDLILFNAFVAADVICEYTWAGFYFQ